MSTLIQLRNRPTFINAASVTSIRVVKDALEPSNGIIEVVDHVGRSHEFSGSMKWDVADDLCTAFAEAVALGENKVIRVSGLLLN